jgi:hypothetical protein
MALGSIPSTEEIKRRKEKITDLVMLITDFKIERVF